MREKGSISVFVLVTLTFFVLVLVGVYMYVSNRNTSLSSQITKIKDEYEMDKNQIDNEYESVLTAQKQDVEILLTNVSDNSEYISGTWTNDSVKVNVNFPDGADEKDKIIYINGQETKYIGEIVVEETTNIKVIYGGKRYEAQINIDKAAPTVRVTADKGSLTNASSIIYTFTFNEDVTGFTADDVTVTNGTKGAFSGSGNSYTLVVNNTGSTTQTVRVDAGVCTDMVGNSNIASNTVTITIDRTPPTLTVEANKTSPTNASSIIYTFTFSEDVTGFTADDVTVTNGTGGAFSGSGKVYTLVVNNSGSTTQSVSVSAGVCIDAAGNGNTASNTLTITIDRTVPTVEITADKESPTNASSITYTFTFSENVTGFAKGDVGVTNGTAGTFSGSGKVYTLVVTNSGSTTQTVSVAAGVCTDGAGNANTAASLSIQIDRTAPTLNINTQLTNPTEVVSTYMDNNYVNIIPGADGMMRYGAFKGQKFSILVTTTDANKISSIQYKISKSNVTANATNFNNLANVELSGSASNKAAGTQTTTFTNRTLSSAGTHYIYVKAVDILGNTSYGKVGIYVYNDMEKFIALCYNNILGRAPDYIGLTNYTNVITNILNGGTPPAYNYTGTSDRKIKAIMNALYDFYYSDEFKREWLNGKPKSEVVKAFYWGMLRRSPSDADIQAWSSSSLDGLFTGIGTSAEAQQKFAAYSLSTN